MMTKKRLLAITILFVVTMTAIRLIWIASSLPADRPLAVQGVLDLREASLERPIPLEANGRFIRSGI